MLFLIHCTQRPDGQAIRDAHYDAHRAYLQGSAVDIKLAGPMVDDDGQKRIGSVFIVDVPGRAEAEAFSASDPFSQHGLFERVIITRFLDITRGKPAFGPTQE
jgi:uncharacterized protein YciI